MNDKEKMTELVKIMDAKKARDIAVIDVESGTIIASYFVIATGGSLTQLNALSDEAQDVMAQKGSPAVKVEGRGDGGWILVDFGGVILHLFTAQTREFYDLERLWNEAPKVDISELLTEN